MQHYIETISEAYVEGIFRAVKHGIYRPSLIYFSFSMH